MVEFCQKLRKVSDRRSAIQIFDLLECVCRLKKVVHSKVKIVRWAHVTETKHPENVTLQAGILYTAELVTKLATKCKQVCCRPPEIPLSLNERPTTLNNEHLDVVIRGCDVVKKFISHGQVRLSFLEVAEFRMCPAKGRGCFAYVVVIV